MSGGNVPISGEGSFQGRVETREHTHHPDHVVQFYAEDTAFLDALSRTISAELRAGHSAVVVATSEHLDGLAHRLKGCGLELAKDIEASRYIPLDASETLSRFMLEGWPDAAGFEGIIGPIIARAASAARGENARVFAYGEMVAQLWMDGKMGSALRLEQLWNDLAKRHSFSLHCAYPMKAFDREEHAEPFLEICAEHSSVIPAENRAAPMNKEVGLRIVSYLQQKSQALEAMKREREQAKRSLHSLGAELTDLLENALEGIQQTGPDQKIRWANKAMLDLLGYTSREFVGRPLAEFHVQQDVFEEFWEKLMCRQDIYDFAAELRCKDGSVKHVLIHCNGLWEGGNLVHTRSFIRDVTERKEMELALRLAHEELEMRVNERTTELEQKNLQILRQSEALEVTNQGLRKLSAHLLHVQDEERRRIARDLHDSTGQSLALLSMNLSALSADALKLSPDLADGIAENAKIVREISTELRTLSYLLHPPLLDEMGLESALRWYIDGFGQRSSIKVSLEMPRKLERFHRNLETAIFRVVQECLTNIHLHSGSPTATIRLVQSPETIILEIEDQGKGIAPEKLSKIESSGLSGLGLRGMRERIKDFQGDMEIVSDEKGTQIRVVVPFSACGSVRPEI